MMKLAPKRRRYDASARTPHVTSRLWGGLLRLGLLCVSVLATGCVDDEVSIQGEGVVEYYPYSDEDVLMVDETGQLACELEVGVVDDQGVDAFFDVQIACPARFRVKMSLPATSFQRSDTVSAGDVYTTNAWTWWLNGNPDDDFRGSLPDMPHDWQEYCRGSLSPYDTPSRRDFKGSNAIYGLVLREPSSEAGTNENWTTYDATIWFFETRDCMKGRLDLRINMD